MDGRARVLGAVIAGLVVGGAGLVVLPDPAHAAGKVTICHRTHSVKNPYRRISVSVSAVNGSSNNDHTHHAGPPFEPGRTYLPSEKVWGDVVPDSRSGGSGAGFNWTAAGQALYQSSWCGAMSAQEFYNVEREAGVPREQILADLAEQQADGDDPTTLSAIVYTGTDPSVPESSSGAGAGDPAPSTGSEPAPSAGSEPVPSTGSEPVPSTGSEPAPSTGSDPVPSTGSDPAPSTGSEPVPSTGSDPAPSTGSEPAPSTGSDPEPSTGSDPDPGTPVPGSDSGTEIPPAPPAVPVPAKRAVVGTVWLDLNRNGEQDGGEPGVPGVEVRLLTVPSRVLAAAALDVPAPAARTDRAGRVRFADVSPGDYRLVVTVPSALTVTKDSEGPTDAEAGVTVPTEADGEGWAGLVGDAVLTTTLTTPEGSAGAGRLFVRWAGVDDVLHTADDVLLPAEAVDGVVRLDGLPAGRYALASDPEAAPAATFDLGPGEARSLDLALPVTAEEQPAAPVAVPSGPDPAAAAVPSGPHPVTAAVATPAPGRGAAARPGAPVRASALPRTGGTTDLLAGVAASALTAGVLLQLLGSRRRRT